MDKKYFKSLLRTDFGETSAQRGLRLGQLVHLFVKVNAEAVFTDTATLSDANNPVQIFIARRLQNSDPPCSESPTKSLLAHRKLKKP